MDGLQCIFYQALHFTSGAMFDLYLKGRVEGDIGGGHTCVSTTGMNRHWAAHF
jgi:hypothetical protein